MKKVTNEHSAFVKSEAGIKVLEKIDEKLHLAGDELLRMEDESGISLDKKQTAKVDSYSKTSKKIKKVLVEASTDNNLHTQKKN